MSNIGSMIPHLGRGLHLTQRKKVNRGGPKEKQGRAGRQGRRREELRQKEGRGAKREKR